MSFPPRPFPGGAPFGYAPQPIFFNPIRTFNPQAIQPPVPQKPSVTTTVFVGNITERCTNDFMQKMLEECGKVASWKRIQGVNGKYQAFGFCDFEQPEGTLRALRILNDFQVGEKKLVVKAEDKVRSDLRSWAIARRKEQGKADLKLKDHELPADEDDKNKDEEIRLKILSWIETDHPELLTVGEDGELSETERKARRKEERRHDDRKGRRRSRSSSRGRNDRKRRRSRSNRRKRRRSVSSSSRSSGSRSTYSSNSSRSRSRSSSPSNRRRKRSNSRHSDSDVEERRALKRALKAKERAYQDRLGKWEDREKEKARYYDKLDRREKDRKLQIIKESKKLKTFLEDYNDEEDDAKYFRHSELFRRRRDVEKERQQDAKDRLNEVEEIEAIKREIMEQNKVIAEEADKKAREQHKAQEEAAMRKLRGDSGSPNPHHKLGRANGAGESDSSSSSAESEDEKMSPDSSNLGMTTTTVKPEQWTTSTTDETRTPPVKEGASNGGIALKTTTTMVKVDSVKAKLATVFGMEEEEDVDHLRTRKQLKPFEITNEERMENITELEKNKIVKGIITKIPSSKQDLFNYSIHWDGVDDEFLNQRIRPWVLKKVREFIGGIGDEEKSLCDFICDKVKEKVNAMQLIEDVKMILDDDAEMFVVKMWRLLIFETECKATGLKNLPARKELK